MRIAPELQECVVHSVVRERILTSDAQRDRVKPRRMQIVDPPERGCIAGCNPQQQQGQAVGVRRSVMPGPRQCNGSGWAAFNRMGSAHGA
jgi:hypothetical protein